MVGAAGYPRVEPWEDCRFSFLDFHFSTVQKEERDVGLGTLLRQRERRFRLHGTYPGFPAGFPSRIRDGVKRSRSNVTLLARHAGPGRAPCQGAQIASDREAKAVHLYRYAEVRSSLDASLRRETGGA
jgi:hypothetical protein